MLAGCVTKARRMGLSGLSRLPRGGMVGEARNERHPRESGDPFFGLDWIPAFAGMTIGTYMIRDTLYAASRSQ
jgi:hypothetical protein